MKEFKGIITGWIENVNGTVKGRCLYHTDHPEWADHQIRTSWIVKMSNMEWGVLLETRNSIYVLVNERKEDE